MINLLPPRQKKELQEEENWKVVFLIETFLFLFFILLSLNFLSVRNFISGEAEVQQILLDQRESELANPRAQVLRKNLTDFNQTLSQLNSFYKNQLKFSYVLEEIAKTVTSGVSLSSLNLAKKDKGMICSLRGFAEDRNSLLKFKENLEKNEIFSDVFFPQGSWVEPSDIDFTLNFKISEFK